MTDNLNETKSELIEKKIEFIDDYAKAENAASGSKYDPNANVSTKNIATLASELPKKDIIDLNRELMRRQLTSDYGKDMADKYMEDLNHHTIYKHDETSIFPYTYSAGETVLARIDSRVYLIPMERLYDLCGYAEDELEDMMIWGKNVTHGDIEVYDKDGWTKVSRLIKKRRGRDLYHITVDGGFDMVVTDNHPMIIGDDIDKNVVDAKDSFNGENKQKRIDPTECWGRAGKQVSPNHFYDKFPGPIDMNGNTGYLVGYYIFGATITADEKGHKHIGLTDTKFNGMGKLAFERVFGNKDFSEDACYAFMDNIMEVPDDKAYRNLPIDCLRYGREFCAGLINGAMDSSMTVDDQGFSHIMCPSRSCATQLAWLARELNCETVKTVLENDKWTVVIGYEKSNEKAELGWRKITSSEKLTDSQLTERDNFIYDITTESHSLVVNNLLGHNCCSISLYPFLLDGLTKLGGTSVAPKHADSFCGEFCNLVFAVAAQFAGACLYKDMNISVKIGENNPEALYNIKEFVNGYNPVDKLPFHKGWLYKDISNEGILVFENHRWVKVKKVYKHEYLRDDIYSITTNGGTVIRCSKDHKLAIIDKKKITYVAASELKIGEQLVRTGEFENDGPVENDCIAGIVTFINDDDYVYEIETDSHYYSAGGYLSHNCATSEFLTYLDMFLRVDYGQDYTQHLDKVVETRVSGGLTIQDKIENMFQQVVYTINQPAAARGNQSVFWNIAYFDRYYFAHIFNGFVFPNGEKPVFDSVNVLQRLFMKWFNKERTKQVLTFPVETFNLLTDSKGEYIDKENADFAAEMLAEGHSFFIYQSDSVDALASCCFDGSQKVKVQYDEAGVVVKPIKKIVDADLAGEIHNLKVFSNGTFKAAKSVKLPKKKMYKVVLNDGKRTTILETEDHINVTKRGDIATKDLELTDEVRMNDVNSVKCYCDIESIKPYETKDEYVYCFQMVDDTDPYFSLANGVITHNCRLRNAIEAEPFSYTLGAGGIETGSKGVITMNINRIVQDWDREGRPCALKDRIAEITKRIHKYLTSFNNIIWKYKNAGLLTVYDAGFISLDKQYVTLGISGLAEGAEYLGYKISPDDENYKQYAKDILTTIKDLNKADKTEHCKFNTEFVPAESLGAKNAHWDKKDGYKVPRDVYNSYFYIVEDDHTSILDKFRLMGRDFTGCLDGGSALHMNLDEHLSFQQYRVLMDLAVKDGCNYFTFNIPNTVCNDCGFITKQHLDHCPKCGSHNVDYLTRVIGYLKRVSNFSPARQQEASKRYYEGEKDVYGNLTGLKVDDGSKEYIPDTKDGSNSAKGC
jgi:anaerobic ribonucleoside-triphosphate reductase